MIKTKRTLSLFDCKSILTCVVVGREISSFAAFNLPFSDILTVSSSILFNNSYNKFINLQLYPKGAFHISPILPYLLCCL